MIELKQISQTDWQALLQAELRCLEADNQAAKIRVNQATKESISIHRNELRQQLNQLPSGPSEARDHLNQRINNMLFAEKAYPSEQAQSRVKQVER